MKRQIAVLGHGMPTRREYNVAAEVGRELARRDIAIVCGGLFGVMEAACMGAKEAGGTTIGLLRSYNRTHANPYVDYVIPTGLGDARNVLVARAGEAAIAIGGRLGTLSEIALALKHGIPVVGIGTWRLEQGMLFDRFVPSVKSAKEAVDLALTLIDQAEQRARRQDEPEAPPDAGLLGEPPAAPTDT